jgi:hypothetical protein
MSLKFILLRERKNGWGRGNGERERRLNRKKSRVEEAKELSN